MRWTSTLLGNPLATAWLTLRGKALPDQTGELLAILRDILERARLDNRRRAGYTGRVIGGDLARMATRVPAHSLP